MVAVGSGGAIRDRTRRQTLKALGVSPASALQAPWPLIRTFPPGSTLSRQDALTQHDTLAPVIGAEALPTEGAR